MRRTFLGRTLCCLLLAAAPAGCHRTVGGTPPESGPPAVPVSQPVRRDVTDYADYTGRIEAIQRLDVRARVTGFLVRLPFREGSEVKKGDLLFEIDPRPYQAQLDAAKAQVRLAEAAYNLARANNARSKAIASRDAGAISREELQTYEATEAQANANLGVAKANQNLAQLNLDFCSVTSPIDGQVSRFFLTLGNLVLQDQTDLTTVVSVDPVFAYFDMDERTILRVRRLINEGKIQLPKNREDIPILVGLEGENGFPHQGKFDFANNTINPSTGTITVRGVFDNPQPQGGRRLFTPGMFVRVRIPIGSAQPALLVIDRAVGSDQGLRFVYVVGEDNTVQYRRVEVGPLQDDGLRVIRSGIKPDDWVVVGGLQQVRPRLQVSPDRIPMPTLSGPDGEEAPGGEKRPEPPPGPDKEKGRQGDKEKAADGGTGQGKGPR
jgi:multidrug efflux system membrane fusion protein